MEWRRNRSAKTLSRVGNRVLPAILLFFLTTAARASIFVVNNTGDAGDANPGNGICETAPGNGICTLRAAIQEANAHAGADTITFAIGSGVQTIAPATALPSITDPVTIDGTTQPGFAGSPIVEINGGSVSGDGLAISATNGGSTIRGLVINRFKVGGFPTGSGIGIYSTNNVVEGCFLGTNVAARLPVRGTRAPESSSAIPRATGSAARRSRSETSFRATRVGSASRSTRLSTANRRTT